MTEEKAIFEACIGDGDCLAVEIYEGDNADNLEKSRLLARCRLVANHPNAKYMRFWEKNYEGLGLLGRIDVRALNCPHIPKDKDRCWVEEINGN